MILPDLARFDRIAFDTETTGLGYSPMPVGLSWATPDGERGYARWGHVEGGNNISLAQVQDWAHHELCRRGLRVFCHNAMYDVHMMHNIGVPELPLMARVEDTGYMAALINELQPNLSLGGLAKKYLGEAKGDEELNAYCAEKFGGRPTRRQQAGNYYRAHGDVVEPYAISDADLTLRLADVLYEKVKPGTPLASVYELETDLLPLMVRMYRHGVRVDVAAAEEHAARVEGELATLSDEWERVTGGIPVSGPGSRLALEKLWEDLSLPFGSRKRSNGSINSRSINQDLLKELAPHHGIPRILNEIRLRSKVLNTFLRSYILDEQIDGRLHARFNQLRGDGKGTISGRFSSSDPNLQNAPSPKRDDEEADEFDQYGKLFRTLFIPEPDSRWVSIDYSQIEYRFFAHYAGGAIQQAFLDDPTVDFHQWCADQAGVSRTRAKNGNFAKLYGAGLSKLADTLDLSPTEAKVWVTEYEAAIPDAGKLFREVQGVAKRRGYIRTWGDRYRRFNERGVGRRVGTHSALNALLQGSAADLMKRAMLRVADLVDWDSTYLHLTVHDELDFSAPRGEVGDRWISAVKEAMTDFDLTVPILADVEHGPSWGELEPWTTS